MFHDSLIQFKLQGLIFLFFFWFVYVILSLFIFRTLLYAYLSSADFNDWFQLKGKSHKTFNIIVYT
jgi:hypothetical protein